MGLENAMYFKTILINVWYAVLVCMVLTPYFYNMRMIKIVAPHTNLAALILYPVLFIPILVDCIVDVVTEYKPGKTSESVSILLAVAMTLIAFFGMFYVISYRKIFTQCVDLSCYAGYTPVSQTVRFNNTQAEDEDKLNLLADKVKSNYSGNDDESEDDRIERRLQTLKSLRRRDWFAVMNLHLTLNNLWAVVATDMMLMLVYIMRAVTISDDNINREVDVAIIGSITFVLLILTVIYDFFVFRRYSYPAFMHYTVFFLFSTSLLIEFHSLIGAEEGVTLVLMAFSAACRVVKVKQGISYREALFSKLE